MAIGEKARPCDRLLSPFLFIITIIVGIIMIQKNILSRRQFREAEFNTVGCQFNMQPGNLLPRSTASGGGKRKKLVAYMTFTDGRKIVAPTWPRSRYEGLANMETGAQNRVLYEESRSGTLRIRRAVLLEEPTQGIKKSELIRFMELRD